MFQYFSFISFLGLVLGLVILIFNVTLLAFFNISLRYLVKFSYNKVINFIKVRKLKIVIYLLFYLLLFAPFSYMLYLLGLKVYIPLVSGIYACIFATVSLFIHNKSHLLSFVNYVFIITYSILLAYIMYIINNSGLFHLNFALPLLMEVGINNESINISNKIALLMNNDSDSLSSDDGRMILRSPSPTPTPPPTPNPEQVL